MKTLRDRKEMRLRGAPAFVVLFAVMLALHMGFTLGLNDDAVYGQVLATESVAEFSARMYATWSSRQLIEAVMVLILHFPWLWRIVDSLMFVLAAWSVFRMFPEGDKRRGAWLAAGLTLLYPVYLLRSAGWVVTTVNYAWPLGLGLFAALGLKKALCGEKLRWYEYVLMLPALVFAVNAEQVCVALLVASVGTLLYMALKTKPPLRGWIYPAAALAVCLVSVVYIMTCPGVALRRAQETAVQFPSFGAIPLWMKLEMAFSSTVQHFALQPNLSFIVFSLLLLTAVAARTNSAARTAVAAAPLAAQLIFGFVVRRDTFEGLFKLTDSVGTYGTLNSYGTVRAWVPLLAMVTIVLCVAVGVWEAFEDKRQALGALLILLCGLASRMVMALTPTIWVSGARTFIYLYFAFYAVAQQLAVRTVLPENARRPQGAVVITALLCGFSALNLLFMEL